MSSLTEVPVGSPPFRHEALFYAGDDEYLKGTVPYVEDGLASGEPVLVVVPQDRLELLRDALPTGNPLLQLADMEAIGRNPARIIPAWADFVLPLLAEGRTSRGIGEPIWPGRSAEELTECTWHETLINTAFGEAAGFSLLCPYDTTGLDPSVIEAAYSTHPLAGPPDGITPSSSYRTELPTCPDEPLSPIPEDASVAAVRRTRAPRAAPHGADRGDLGRAGARHGRRRRPRRERSGREHGPPRRRHRAALHLARRRCLPLRGPRRRAHR